MGVSKERKEEEEDLGTGDARGHREKTEGARWKSDNTM